MVKNAKFRLSDTLVRILVVILVFVAMTIINPVIASFANIVSILNNSVYVSLLALALTILMVMNILDLAVTAYGVFSAFLVIKLASMYWHTANMWVMVIAACILGALCTVLPAYLISTFRVGGFVLSIAVANMLHMGLFIFDPTITSMSGPDKVPKHLPDMVKTNLFSAQVGNIKVSLNIMVLIVAILVVLVSLFLNKTTIGRNIFAIGGNYEAAKRMGIDTKKTYYVAYAIAGALCALAMMRTYMTQETTIVPLSFKNNYGDAMAAVIYGGTLCENGAGGSVAGTMAGVLLITLIRTNLVIIGVPSYAQTFVISLLLMGSVVLSSLRKD